jgi:hypothetical protein
LRQIANSEVELRRALNEPKDVAYASVEPDLKQIEQTIGEKLEVIMRKHDNVWFERAKQERPLLSGRFAHYLWLVFVQLQFAETVAPG